jgi:hypothetical protein
MERINSQNALEFVGGTCTFSENGLYLNGIIIRMEYVITAEDMALHFTLGSVCDTISKTQMHDHLDIVLSLLTALRDDDDNEGVVISQWHRVEPYGQVWVFQRPSAVG